MPKQSRDMASLVDAAWVLARKLVTATISQVNKRYRQLKDRYGPRYTKAMLGGVFFALFVPLPGATLLAIACVAVIAEAHRAMSKKRCSEAEFEPVHGWTKRQFSDYLARNPAYRPTYYAMLRKSSIAGAEVNRSVAEWFAPGKIEN
jgi:hypothetical protein